VDFAPALAHHGWNVRAVDLPGHGKAPETRLNRSSCGRLHHGLCSTRQGSRRPRWSATAGAPLIALQVASAQPGPRHLAMVGTAFPMKVSPALLDMSLNQPLKAIVNQFSHSMLAPPPSAMGPGTWLYGTAGR
jgi:hypothetical protein